MNKFLTLLLFLFATILIIKADNGISVKLMEAPLADNVTAPQYPGGKEALYEYLKSNIKYPELLVKIKMEGEVDVKFRILETGAVTDVEILRGFDPLADDEVVRVVKGMRHWAPGTLNGRDIFFEQKVTVSFHITDALLEELNKPKDGNEKKTDLPNPVSSPDIIDNTNKTAPSDTLLNKAPQFPGGVTAMEEYFKANMKYPKQAIKYGVEGRVVFQLTISPTGEISRILIVKGIFRDCDEEAFFLIKKMPNWIPGLKDGKPASMTVLVPVPFELPG